MKNSAGSFGLRIVLFLASLLIMLTGINIALGGIFTLGLQGDGNFADVTNETLFLAQDSHIRFIGGVWFCVGVLFMISSFNLFRFQGALKFGIIATLIGGLARLSQINPEVTFGPDILPSLIAEVIGMPLLYFWLSRVIKRNENHPLRD